MPFLWRGYPRYYDLPAILIFSLFGVIVLLTFIRNIFTLENIDNYSQPPSFRSTTYDWNAGLTSVALSSAAYCPPEYYLTMSYVEHAKGFVPTAHLTDPERGTEGFVGYVRGQGAIYVVFRGLSNIKTWVAFLDMILTTYPHCAGCEVHLGFSHCTDAIYPQVLSAVRNLRQQYPDFEIVVTGHSQGAAIATLTALELQQSGMSNVRSITFGSPRVGNSQFAEWATVALGPRSARNTHHKDMVPHIPLHERFTHIGHEYYEDPVLQLRECRGFEDPDCSNMWHITSIDDHMFYLGKELGEIGCINY